MTTYWIMFMLAAMAVVFPQRADLPLRNLLLVLLGIFYAFLIGFRFEVGGDWFTYLYTYNQGVSVIAWQTPSFVDSLSLLGAGTSLSGDIAFIALVWLMIKLEAGIYGVNLVCGLMFVSGVVAFARKQPLPWLAIAVVVPYLMIVVAMGYTRQSAALGLIFWALAILRDGHVLRYVLMIVVAALFHKAALMMLPFGFLSGGKKTRGINFIIFFGAVVIFGIVLMQSHIEALWTNYVQAKMVSDGGLIRVSMNVVALVIMFVFWKRWKVHFRDYRIWFWMGFINLILLGVVDFASTAVDRMALYLAPIQAAVYSRLPVLINNTMLRTVAVVCILTAYTAVLWVWLNLGNFSSYWLPYQNGLFQ